MRGQRIAARTMLASWFLGEIPPTLFAAEHPLVSRKDVAPLTRDELAAQ
jgi:hypothetical protein